MEKYERADLELVYFDSTDIIRTSTVLGGGNEGGGSSGSWDMDGWT